MIAKNDLNSLHDVAESWSQNTIEAFVKMIDKKKIGQSGFLRESFKRKVIGSLDSVEAIEFAFAYYGKYVDMGVHRGVHISDVRSNNDKWARIERKNKGIAKPKDKKWYNNTLAGRLKDLNKLMQEYYGIHSIDFIDTSIKKNLIIEI